jgi:crotonobetaine/carnitine-CoA ligase
MSIPRLLRRQAQARADAPFVQCEGVTLSYGEADQRASRAANVLEECGVRRGDNVVLMMANSLGFLDAWFGLTKLGAVMVPVNPALKGESLAHVLRHSEARLAVVDPDARAAVDATRPGSALERVLISEQAPAEGDTWTDLVAGASSGDPGHEPEGSDLCSILYTSGTTGLPKGVMLPHHSFVNTGRYFAHDICGAGSDDRFFTVLPLFHVNAQQLSTMGALVSGVPLVLARRFSATGFWDELRRCGATIFNYIGAMVSILWKQPEGPADRDHRVRLAVGAAAPAEVWRGFETRFGLTLLEGYGLTETGTVATINPRQAIRVGSIGRPVRWCDVRVVDESDTDRPVGESGEIVVRFTGGHTGMLGYFREPQATAHAMRGGWFHTGDRGRIDADGYCYFIDRIKDCIRRRGENISSFELEKALAQHPGVLEVAVVGVPSELGEDEVMACVVAQPGVVLDAADFHSWAAGRLAAFQVPRYVRLLPSLPKTETQRTQKYVLRDTAFEGEVWDARSATLPVS